MKVCQRCQGRFRSSDWTCTECGFIPPKRNGFSAFAEELAGQSGSFDPERMPVLYKLESSNFWFRARNRLILSSIQRFFPDSRRFLEVGCGTGYVLSGVAKAYPALNLTGAELLDAGLEFASRRVPDAELIQMDARVMPFDQEFDLIGSFDVLEHIDEDDQVLRQFNGSLTGGGGLILTVPQHMWLWSESDVKAHHCRRYSAAEMVGKLQRSGFEVIFMSSFVSLLLPAFFISRMIQRLRGGKGGVRSELQIGGLANFVLETVLNFEVALISRGLTFPAGSTLHVVARKVVAVPMTAPHREPAISR